MMTRDQMIDALADERDRLADESDGLSIALAAGCSPVTLAALLVPGIGAIIATTARLACAAMNAAELESRIARLDGLIRQVEDLAVDVNEATDERLPEVERAVRAVLQGLQGVSAVDELADDSMELANGLIDDAKKAAGAAAGILGFIFSPAGAIAGAVGLGLYLFAGRRR